MKSLINFEENDGEELLVMTKHLNLKKEYNHGM
jgi:hypothetical protein